MSSRLTNPQNLVYALAFAAVGSLLYGEIWLAIVLGAAAATIKLVSKIG